MKYTNEFINTIPRYLQGVKKAHLTILTYHNVPTYEEGEVTTGKKGLSATVCTGGQEDLTQLSTVIATANAAMQFGQLDIAEKKFDEYEQILASKAKKSQEGVDTQSVRQEDQLIYVIYAGLSNYKENMKYTTELRKQQPSALIFLLTCDCWIEDKLSFLSPFQQQGTIDEIIVTDGCGGRSALVNILEKFIACWE